MIRFLPLAVLAVCTVAGVAIGFCWGCLWRRAPHTWTSRVARRIAGHPGAPDLSDTIAVRLAQADQIAATGAADLDTVDQHMATVIRDDAAGVVAAALAPDSIEADAAAVIRQAEAIARHAAGDTSDIPIIPGDA